MPAAGANSQGTILPLVLSISSLICLFLSPSLSLSLPLSSLSVYATVYDYPPAGHGYPRLLSSSLGLPSLVSFFCMRCIRIPGQFALSSTFCVSLSTVIRIPHQQVEDTRVALFNNEPLTYLCVERSTLLMPLQAKLCPGNRSTAAPPSSQLLSPPAVVCIPVKRNDNRFCNHQRRSFQKVPASEDHIIILGLVRTVNDGDRCLITRLNAVVYGQDLRASASQTMQAFVGWRARYFIYSPPIHRVINIEIR